MRRKLRHAVHWSAVLDSPQPAASLGMALLIFELLPSSHAAEFFNRDTRPTIMTFDVLPGPTPAAGVPPFGLLASAKMELQVRPERWGRSIVSRSTFFSLRKLIEFRFCTLPAMDGRKIWIVIPLLGTGLNETKKKINTVLLLSLFQEKSLSIDLYRSNTSGSQIYP